MKMVWYVREPGLFSCLRFRFQVNLTCTLLSLPVLKDCFEFPLDSDVLPTAGAPVAPTGITGVLDQIHQENIHPLFYSSTFRKTRRVFLCFTPENEFGNQILNSVSTFQLVRSRTARTSPKFCS